MILRGSLFLYNVYNATRMYMRGIGLNKKTTFSALCVCDRVIYRYFSTIFGTMGLYVFYMNRRKYMKLLSVLLLLVKMDTRLKTFLHILGYFLYNIVSVREHYEEGNKKWALFPVVCFMMLVFFSYLKMIGKIDKTLFIRLYLSVQYIFTLGMLYSVCYISEDYKIKN